MPFSQSGSGSTVTITISRDDYAVLMLCIGYAAAKADPQLALAFFKLANSINQGNPQWVPYNLENLAENFPEQ